MFTLDAKLRCNIDTHEIAKNCTANEEYLAETIKNKKRNMVSKFKVSKLTIVFKITQK